MSLRRKILIYIGITTSCLLILLYLISEREFLRNYKMMEIENAEESMKRVLLSYYDEYKNLESITINYSGFDDIYDFAIRPTIPDINDPYIVSNYPDSLYVSNRLNTTILMNNQKQIYFAKAYDYANNHALPYPTTMIDSLLHEHASFLEHPDAASRKSGLLILDKQPIMFTSFPILTSNNEGPIHGDLVFARFLDQTFTKYLSEKADSKMSFTAVNPSFNLPHDNVTSLSLPGNRVLPFWTETDNTTIKSFTLLLDIENKPALVLEFAQPRELYQQAKKSMLFYLLFFGISGFSFFIIVIFVLQRKIFTRLSHMVNGMNEIESGKNFSIRIAESGKDEFTMLEKSFNHMMSTLEEAQNSVQFQADHDALTGLANRKVLFTFLDHKIKQSQLLDSRFSVFFIDLDHFKLINDTLGHHIGDFLLSEVAERLQICVQNGDFLCRLGGDEFCIVSPNVLDADQIEHMARRLKETIDAPFYHNGLKFSVSASIGISLYPDHGTDAERLLQYADTAMLDVKENGKDNYRLYTDLIQASRTRRSHLEHALKNAVQQDELLLYYQPKWDIAQHKIVGVEALLRWTSPKFGSISPSEFIPIAESSGIINEIGEWTMRSACRQFVVWQNHFQNNSLVVAINISGAQLLQPNFLDIIRHVFTEEMVDPCHFELEVTESFAIQNFDEVIDILFELRGMGFMISIDDFGAGYSSMKYLCLLPIQTMKIDKTLIDHLKDNVRNQVVVSTLIDLCHRLQLIVVAEGVESEEQLQYLQSYGCDQIQGFLISQAVPAEEIVEWMKQHSK